MSDLIAPGNVLVRETRPVGGGQKQRAYIRITRGFLFEDPTGDRVYVQDCDGAGFLLNGGGRYLLKSHIASRYRLHHSPEREDHQ